ncbi:MAG TPA: hypothetical protein DHW82_12960 [Spirochaetia bacterium]|nr:MAG: hypothetical protein A2Y41_00310 [Spirochaetes bacterium GWB1_36_13]HCL57900.1 hypothetical protein [Spirochaetia bacterium]
MREKLSSKIKILESYHTIRSDLIKRFVETVEKLDKWELFRINPFVFAEKYGFSEQEAVELFIYSARSGIFDFSWNFICPHCGAILTAESSLNSFQIKNNRCYLCKVNIPVELDDYVEVSFTINPDIKKLVLRSETRREDFFKYYFSANFIRSQDFREYSAEVFRRFDIVLSEKSKTLSFEAEKGKIYRLYLINLNAIIYFETDQEENKRKQTIELIVDQKMIQEQHLAIHSGKVSIQIFNHMNESIGMTFLNTDENEMNQVVMANKSHLKKFLTGKMLLNNQIFRNIFKIQNLDSNLRLKVRSLTLLFTDLKDSTALYDKIGDMAAYKLIQEHFKILTEIVKKNSGAVIKTMGDAVMASFSEPFDGIKAAVDMIQTLKLSDGDGKIRLGLKIGLHEGHALAIHANEKLDYFGQTVNIAARLQGLSDTNQIWISDSIMQDSKVETFLQENQYSLEKHQVALKGIGSEVKAYKCYIKQL